jgi:hypothetical protein
MLRTLTFGDLDSGLWGAAWELGDGRGGFALVGDGAREAVLTDDWRVTGDELELETAADDQPPEDFDQLVRVRGRVRIAGTEHSLDCLGRRGTRKTLDLAGYESVRDVSAWFSPEDGLALVAARPAGSPGHAADLLTASAFEAGHPLAIAEPRLSTTYDADGSPIRAGLELWLERPVDQDEPGEETLRYPRRVAGEAASGLANAGTGSLLVQARLFRWHARSEEGAGVYVLARSQ